jgi:nitrite reductase/ring-hydroxylating ferredoxin subunit
MSHWVRLIATDGVPEGEGRAVRLPGLEAIAVFRVEGRFFATQDRCSHADASLAEGWVEGFDVSCPVHEGRFDLRDGRPLCFPVTEPIGIFPTEIRDGAVWADIAAARAA